MLLLVASLSTAANCQPEATDGETADESGYDYWLEAPAPEPEYELEPAAEPATEPAAEPAAAPLSDEQILNNCIALVNPAGTACTTESDTLALAYPRCAVADCCRSCAHAVPWNSLGWRMRGLHEAACLAY